MAHRTPQHIADQNVVKRRANLFNLQKRARENSERFCAHLDGMDVAVFRRRCNDILQSDLAPHFSWDKVFIEAARTHNVGALIYFEGNCCVPSQDLLNRALEASLTQRKGENAESAGKTAHYLMLWGADPNTRSSSFTPFSEAEDPQPLRLHELAAIRGLTREREEMAMWSRSIQEDKFPLHDESVAGKIIAHRRVLKNASSGRLHRVMAAALENHDLPLMMAAYAESRKSLWWRGTVTFTCFRDEESRHNLYPGDMILIALEKERYTLVNQMLRHGYSTHEVGERGVKKLLTSTNRLKVFFPEVAPAIAQYKLREIEDNNLRVKPVLPSRDKLKNLVPAPGKSYTPYTYRPE